MIVVVSSFETACLKSPVSMLDVRSMEFRGPWYVFEFTALFVGLDKNLGEIDVDLF